MTTRRFILRFSIRSVAVSLCALGLLLAGCGKDNKSAGKAATKGLETPDQRASYGLGYNIGQNLVRQPAVQIDKAALEMGIEDALAKQKLRIEEKDIQGAFQVMEQRMAKQMEELGKTNLAAANNFLEANKKRSGVKTTMSGLQYEVLKKGGGAKPRKNDRVQVHYHGTFIDGKVFDSSVQRGQPAEFEVGGVIPGWVEALQMMQVGDKWKLYVPPVLAYGARGNQAIPPNCLLVFEVELLAIKK